MLTMWLASRLGVLIEGLPCLLAWHLAEGGAYWRRRRKTSAPAPEGGFEADKTGR